MKTLQNVRRQSNLQPVQFGGQASGAGLFGLPGIGEHATRRTAATSTTSLQAGVATGAANFFARAAANLPTPAVAAWPEHGDEDYCRWLDEIEAAYRAKEDAEDAYLRARLGGACMVELALTEEGN